MNKILLFLILIFSITSIAQSKYTIEKQLQLNTVLRGDPEDSILVRSPDRIVKMISRKELGSNENSRPVSDSLPGIVDTIALQELGGVDKLINGVRIGQGSSLNNDNVVLGKNSLGNATTANNTVAIGTDVLSSNTTGNNNTGVGYGTLFSNIGGYSNTAIGSFSLNLNTEGTNNTGIGYKTLPVQTSGSFNTSIGSTALYSSTTGAQNTAIGASALRLLTTGNYNTAVGISSLKNNSIGEGNTTLGAGAGFRITSSRNIAIGYNALGNTSNGSFVTGTFNIALGFQAGRDLTSGNNNILIENITNASISSGNLNTIIDPRQKAGITTGSNNTIIGGYDGYFPGDTNDTVAIGTGLGVTRFLSNANGLTSVPTQTNALIQADTSGKALITKEYLQQNKTMTGVPVYADNATAVANGLVAGNIYRTSTGVLMITY